MIGLNKSSQPGFGVGEGITIQLGGLIFRVGDECQLDQVRLCSECEITTQSKQVDWWLGRGW